MIFKKHMISYNHFRLPKKTFIDQFLKYNFLLIFNRTIQQYFIPPDYPPIFAFDES